ncbi:MAG: flagellar basal body rod protein FlgB [Janthinobacterium lividum]
MTDGIDALTMRATLLALDASMLRQQAHAANVANAGTAGYRAVSVDFDSQLERARNSLAQRGSIGSQDLPGVAPALVQSAGAVQLDMEMAAMAQNSVTHQSLLAALSRYLAIMASAVADGRR